jgi:hypothetical protein
MEDNPVKPVCYKRFSRLAITTLTVLTAGLTCFTAAAAASDGYKLSAWSTGMFLIPTGIALDNSNTSTGSVYVVADEKLYKFNAEGQQQWQLAVPGADRVAVAGAVGPGAGAGPTEGDIYVTDPTAGTVDRFDRAGDPDPANPWLSGLSSPTGVAVGAEGDVYVTQSTVGDVLAFSPEGAPLNAGAAVTEQLHDPQSVALDSLGAKLYLGEGDKTVQRRPEGSVVVDPLGSDTFDPNGGADVTVDELSDDVFVDEGQAIGEFAPDGSLLAEPLGGPASPSASYSAVAESEVTGAVYATNTTTGTVDVAEPGRPPETPITEPCAGPPRPNALQLCGRLNPGIAAQTGFYFAYDTGTECMGGQATSPGSEMEGEDLGVSTEVTGLEAGVRYTYCLIAKNQFGEAIGSQRTMTVTGPPAGDPLPPATAPAQPEAAVDPGPLVNVTPVILSPHPAVVTKPKPLTKAQKLTKALKACERRPRKQRANCEKQARRLYGTSSHASKSSGKRQPRKK